MLNFLKVFFCFFLYLCLTLHVSSKEKTMNKLEAINQMISASSLSYSAIAKKADVSREQLYRWKNAEVSEPSSDSLFAIADALGYIVKHHNTKNLTLTKKSNIGDNTMIDEHKDYMLQTQQKLIIEYEHKIKRLEKQNKVLSKPKKDSWLDIDFDVKTRQTYDKSFCNYKTYEIIKYQDFFKKLGYNNDEVKIQYEKHKSEMLQSDWKYDDSTLVSTVLGSKKDEAWVMKYKNKNITLYEYLDVRMKLGKSSATYDTPVQYYHKDGHLVNAYIYCSWDLQRLSGETKIKFLAM